MDYLQKTIAAYDGSPDKYASATNDMVNLQEIDSLVGYMPEGNLKVLDVGCAFGRDCRVFADRGLEVTGIDMSLELLNSARELHPNIELLQMDFRNLEFNYDSFAAVWCNAVLLHLNDADITIALSELRRILMPGGAIAVSFKLGEGEQTFVEDFSAEQARYYNFKTEEMLKILMSNNGFTVKKVYVMNERERFGSTKRDLDWVWAFAKRV